jgi:hypothetical protein
MLGTNNGIQTFVNRELAPGAPGDWAGANIRASVPVGPWALVAPPSGVTIGAIGWANPATGYCTNYFQPNSFPGFIHREQQAQGLQTSGSLIVPNVVAPTILSGNPVTALAQGDFLGLFQGGDSVGNSVYANPTTGALIAGASGAGVTVSVSSGGASVTSGVLTTTDANVSGGTIAAGQIVVDSGGNLPPGTYIASAAGTGSGTHLWNLANLDGSTIPNISAGSLTWKIYGQQPVQWLCMESVPAAASFTATLAASSGQGPFGVLTVSAVGSGVIVPGQWIQSAGATPVPLSSNIQIIQQLTGTTGSTGTYLTSNTIAVGSGETFTTYQGQLATISSWSPL